MKTSEQWNSEWPSQLGDRLGFISAIQADAREGMVASERLRPTVVDLHLWVERRLQSLEHRDTSTRNPSTGQVKSNGFAFSAVPDWELRQKLESIIALKTLLGENGEK